VTLPNRADPAKPSQHMFRGVFTMKISLLSLVLFAFLNQAFCATTDPVAEYTNILIAQVEALQSFSVDYTGKRILKPNPDKASQVEKDINLSNDPPAQKELRKKLVVQEMKDGVSLDLSGNIKFASAEAFSIKATLKKNDNSQMDTEYYYGSEGLMLQVNEKNRSIRMFNSERKILQEIGLVAFEVKKLLETSVKTGSKIQNGILVLEGVGSSKEKGRKFTLEVDSGSMSIKSLLIKGFNDIPHKKVEITKQNPAFPLVPSGIIITYYDSSSNITQIDSFNFTNFQMNIDPSKMNVKYAFKPGFGIDDETSGTRRHYMTDDILSKDAKTE
jgi:hypothetical protein